MNRPMDMEYLVQQLALRIRQCPDDAEAYASLAGALAQLGRMDEAYDILQQGMRHAPESIAIQHNLAELYRNRGAADKAEKIFRAILAQDPSYVPAYRSLLLIETDKLARGHASGQARNEALCEIAVLNNNLGNAYLAHGHTEAAEAAYRDALRLAPHYVSALSNLSNALRTMGRVTEAEKYAREALAQNNACAEAWNNLGSALAEQGRPHEAADCYQEALDLQPGLSEARHNAGSGSLFLLLYREDLSTAEIVAAHRQWGANYALDEAPAEAAPRPPRIGRTRIGFISGDFREHAMMQFVESVLEHLDRDEFDLTCYANQTIEDHVTQRIRALPLVWRNIAGLDDLALQARIAQDDLDLLIDLSGHSLGHRVYALAAKPAPRMANWLGYMCTSGLPAFDYRITDPWTDPAACAAGQHTERVVHLARSQFIYRPKQHLPPVSALPALENGYVTFGSLNNINKLNRRVIAAWSRIMADVPDSRILLRSKLLGDPGVAGWVRGMFEACGIDAWRLDLRPFSAAYLETYQEIDIALDTFPYNGGTTSCDALWMGVPVLTLAGDRSVGRMGVSILTALGMQSWIGDSVEDYVDCGRCHAADIEALAALRDVLRERFAQSSLRDEKGFALDFARCIRQMLE